MRPLAIFVLLLVLSLNATFASNPARAQKIQAPEVNKTIVSDGMILLNGRPFPMVLDAGTDCFTPQDYDIVMGSKDAYGANTWWLQFTMRAMTSQTEGDFTGLERGLDFFEKTGMKVNLYLRAEYRDVPDWFFEKYHDYRMLDPAGKPVGSQICLQHEGFRRLVDQYLRRAVRTARAKPSLLMYSIYDEFCIRGWGCFCPRCVEKYRVYLRSQYGSLQKLNEAWKSGYRSWDEIDAPRTQSFDPNYGDWQRYRLKVLHDFGLLYYRAVKEEDPDHLVWIDINMDLYGYTWQRLCVWWKLTAIFDAFNLGPDSIADGGAVRTAMNRAVRDHYAKGATWHLGISGADFTGRPEMYSLLFESNHGGVVWWYSFWDTLRWEQAWGVGSETETTLQANWFSARELNHLVQYLDDLYTDTRPARGKVAVFVSGLTDMMRSLTAHQTLQTEDALNMGGLCQILRDLNITYE
ncbi:MAG: beta-galactosidase, partial [Acidobacteria bacterium]|nr:beta-galactosidase [Acidobacteriota bacterium]